MKLLRNLLLPRKVFLVSMYKDGHGDEKKVFLDEGTMDRWVSYMRDYGYEIRGFIESISLIVNNKGN